MDTYKDLLHGGLVEAVQLSAENVIEVHDWIRTHHAYGASWRPGTRDEGLQDEQDRDEGTPTTPGLQPTLRLRTGSSWTEITYGWWIFKNQYDEFQVLADPEFNMLFRKGLK